MPDRPRWQLLALAALVTMTTTATLDAQTVRLRPDNRAQVRGILVADPQPTSWPWPGFSLRVQVQGELGYEQTIVCMPEIVEECSRLRRGDRIRHIDGYLTRAPGTVPVPQGYVDTYDVVIVARDIDT